MGTGFAIFGGIGELLYNDLSYYDISMNYWISIDPIGDLPSERYGSCMAIGRFAYIIGGYTNNGVNNDIWVFNFYSNSYTLAQNIGTIDLYIIKHNCWIISEEKYETIFVVSGESYYKFPNQKIYNITIYPTTKGFNYLILEMYHDQLNLLGRSDSSIIVSGSYLFQFFGSIYGFYATSYLLALHKGTFETKIIGLPIYTYGQTLVQYKKSFYIFGGDLSMDGTVQMKLYSSGFYKLTLEATDGIDYECSLGTFGNLCDPCIAGTYGVNSSYCMQCSIGKASNYKASDSSLVCNVCGYGKYSNILGAKQCNDCEQAYICFIGSKSATNSQGLEEDSMIQPVAYSSSSNIFAQESIYLIIVGFAVCIIIGFLLSKKYRKVLKKIDLYRAQHSNKELEPIMLKKTEIGGLFSAIFLVVALIAIGASIAVFSNNNIYEDKGLVPWITVTETIVSKSFTFSAVFYGYAGQCIMNSMCSKYIFISDSALNYTHKLTLCSKESGNCIVTIEYTNIQIDNNPSISISFQEPDNYATHISINVTSFSSIPGEVSSILLYTYPDSLATVFRGPNPTIFSLKIIPSVIVIKIFYSQSNNWPSQSTGYHIGLYNNPIQGSTMNSEA